MKTSEVSTQGALAVTGHEDAWYRQVSTGRRFRFGRNWSSFLGSVDEGRIVEAVHSLEEMLGPDALAGQTFLDAGCGSGLFSLAAVSLGASRIHSFDFDPDSVTCANELKRHYARDAERWTIERGDALDREYLVKLGTWDVVYSWGVLHHTGSMWHAVANVARCVRDGGLLYISIYNDQGVASVNWRHVKKLYNAGAGGRAVVLAVSVPLLATGGVLADLARGRAPWTRYRDYRCGRGMSIVHDWIDWLGGYPFEVARPEEVFDFVRARGFTLCRLKTCGGRLGCNEFVFRKTRLREEQR